MGGPISLELDGRRVLVVGASSGIGSAIADAAMAAGAHVALAARRVDRLETLIAAASGSGRGRGVAVACDVREPGSVAPAVARAIDALEGLDAVVYATGVNHLALLEHTTPDAWELLFETNVVGAALVTAAALPALRSSRRAPRVGLCSSHSVPDPWPGLVAYAATKAALDTMIHGWRTEEPSVSFTRIVVGPTMTPMAEAWDPAVAAEFFARWDAEGRFVDVDPVEPALVAGEVLRWLADPAPPHDLVMPNAGTH